MSDSSSYVTLPPGERGLIEIVRTPDDCPIRVLFLSEYDGIFTHWTGTKLRGKGVECMGAACKHPDHDKEPRWRGYASARFQLPSSKRWLRCVFELSHILSEDLAPARPLRGQVWECVKIARKDKKETRAVHVVTLPSVEDAFDFVPFVEKLYNRKGLLWGKSPPFCARAYDTPIEIPGIPGDEPHVIDMERAKADAAEARRLIQEARGKVRTNGVRYD